VNEQHSFVNASSSTPTIEIKMKTRTTKPAIGSRYIVALVTASLVLAAPSVHAEMKTIVAENFSGSGAVLNGKTADTFDSGITAVGGSSTWKAHPNWKDNGGVPVSSAYSSAYLNLGTYINDAKGTTNGLFELTMTMSPTVGSSGWLSLGFALENSPSTNDNFNTAGATGVGTMAYRVTSKVAAWGGYKTALAISPTDQTVSGTQTLTVVLDLTPDNYDGLTKFGKVTFRTNGVTIASPITYTGTRSFGSIFLSQATALGTNSTLTLTQTNIPSVPSTTTVSVKTNNTVNLNLANSWVNGNSPFNTTNIAKWDSTVQSANTVSLGADTIWGGINISNPVGTVTINAGNTLTLGNEPIDIDMSQATANLTLNCAVALGADNVWDVTDSRTLTVGGAVSGSFNLTKQNLGAAILTAANSHVGTNIIKGGTLTLSGSGNLGNTANNLTLGGGGLDLGGSSRTVGEVSITAARASGQTITNGSLTGTSYSASNPGGNAIISANLLANGAAGFIKSGAGTVTLSGNNTYTGATDITGGAINIQTINGLGTTAGGTTVTNGASLQLQGGLSFPAEALTVGTGGSSTPVLQNVSGDNTWTGTIDTSGAGTLARISSDTNLLTLPNTITGNDPATSVVLQGAGSILVSGKITGSSGVLWSSTGAGTRTLSNPANDFTGQVQLNGGTLRLGTSEVIPDGFAKGNVTFGTSSAKFDLNGYSETINGLNSSVKGTVDNTATNTTATLTVGGNDQSSSYDGVIRNTGGTLALTKIGSGTLLLAGTNTYTGNTIVNGGVLELGVASIAPNSTVSVADGAVLQLDFAGINVVSGFVTNGVPLPAGFVYNDSNVAHFIYSLGGGSLAIYSGDVVVKTNNTDNLDQGSSWVGGITPAYRVAKWDSTVTSPNTVNLGTDANWGGINISNPVGTVTINTGNTLTIGAAPVDIDMSQATANLTLNCDLAMNGSNVWDVKASRTLTLGGIVSGPWPVTKQGAGTAILSGANTYSGGTAVATGSTLITALDTNLNSLGTGAVSLSSGATNQVNNLNITNAEPVLGNIFTGSGRLIVNFAADTTSARNTRIYGMTNFTGTLELANSGAGTTGDKWSNPGVIAPGLTVQVDSGNTIFFWNNSISTFAGLTLSGPGNSEGRSALRFGNAAVLNGPVTLRADSTIGSGSGESATMTGNVSATGVNTLTVGLDPNTAGNMLLSGILNDGSGTLSLVKDTAGTLTLTGTNSYSGNTTVSNGTLLVNNPTGSGTGTGAVTINGGALGGTGIISGVVTNNAGGTLSPGTSIGTLTINGNLTLKPGSTNTFEVNGSTPTNDVVVLGAGVTYGGVLNIVTNGTFTAGQTFKLFSGAGATNVGNFASLVGSPGGGKAFSFTNGVLSVVTAGPSGPATLTNSLSGSLLSLSWPAGQGWRLQVQTNSLATGLGTNWFYLTDGSVNSTNITVISANPTVFYRLKYP
jgi:autotransporter-associated beta strand protein